MNIGLVDLDTSHPSSWVPILRELGHNVVAVWDGGSVHPPGYARTFAQQHDIPYVVDALEDMLEHVDVAILHSCDWDTHVDKARPFVAAGKGVLVDKPVAGCLEDLAQFQSWADQGARIAGGSSLRFCVEARAFLEQPEAQRGRPHAVFCGCGVDEFSYGIHGYALLAAIMGTGAATVQWRGHSVQQRVEVKWDDGRTGQVITGAADEWLPFHASIVTGRTVHQFIVDKTRIYRSLLEAVMPYLAGEVDHPPISMTQLLEPERWGLAAKASQVQGGATVPLQSLTAGPAFDGAAYADEYRRARYPCSILPVAQPIRAG